MAEDTAAVTEPTESQDVAAEGSKEEVKLKLTQSVEITDVGPCKKHIKVAVNRSDIDKLLDEQYKDLVGDSQVPGFRPGRAPRQVVVRKFKKDVFERVRGTVLLTSLEQLSEDHDIAPLAPPNLNPDKLNIPDKGDFEYEFEVEVRPQFDLPDYKAMKLRRPVRKITDQDVQDEKRRILSQFGQLVPKSGPAAKGDFIVCDMTSKAGDRSLGTAKEVTLRIDDTVTFRDGVAPKFAEQTVGAQAGDVKTVDISLTGAVADSSLQGQGVAATLEVKDVKELRLPELNEEFLSGFGLTNEDQLNERCRALLERRLEYAQRQAAREQILQQISAASTWELPKDLLMRQARRAFQRRVMEMREGGMSEEQIQGQQRLLERDVLKSTEESLKEHFVLQKIAETEKIEITEEEIHDEIIRIADQIGESPRKVRAQMEREDLLETLAAQLIERKALDLILSNATYQDYEATKEASVSSVEAQAVEGEVKDVTAAPEASAEEKSGDA